MCQRLLSFHQAIVMKVVPRCLVCQTPLYEPLSWLNRACYLFFHWPDCRQCRRVRKINNILKYANFGRKNYVSKVQLGSYWAQLGPLCGNIPDIDVRRPGFFHPRWHLMNSKQYHRNSTKECPTKTPSLCNKIQPGCLMRLGSEQPSCFSCLIILECNFQQNWATAQFLSGYKQSAEFTLLPNIMGFEYGTWSISLIRQLWGMCDFGTWKSISNQAPSYME